MEALFLSGCERVPVCGAEEEDVIFRKESGAPIDRDNWFNNGSGIQADHRRRLRPQYYFVRFTDLLRDLT
jgi:hypothetical protein